MRVIYICSLIDLTHSDRHSLHINDTYEPIYSHISVRTMPINHGCNDSGKYDAAAFFIRYDPTGREFLFFGDVEPDSLSSKPQTINVWRAAAPKIPGLLSTIFIECSWPSARPDDMLYGHLKPEHLVNELAVLAAEVIKVRTAGRTDPRPRPVRKRQRKNPAGPEELYGALTGVRVFVTHCKDAMDTCEQPVKSLIIEQIRTLVAAMGLGAEILATDQGMRIGACGDIFWRQVSNASNAFGAYRDMNFMTFIFSAIS